MFKEYKDSKLSIVSSKFENDALNNEITEESSKNYLLSNIYLYIYIFNNNIFILNNRINNVR
jgi:hypothetical protein